MFHPQNKQVKRKPKLYAKVSYIRNNYHQYRWPYRCNTYLGKKTDRPSSPFLGTEEHTLKKIQETSDFIKKQLSMPFTESVPQNPIKECKESNSDVVEVLDDDKEGGQEKPTVQKSVTKYNIEEIHNTIISHITNMSYRKKLSLISSTSSGFDGVIQHIQKQKRLELSKALREMCSNNSPENSEYVDSIIPDFGIRIGDLPLEIIAELSKTLNGDSDFSESQKNGAIVKEEPVDCENFDYFTLDVKEEIEEKKRSKTDNLDKHTNNETKEVHKTASKSVQTDFSESQLNNSPTTLTEALSSMFVIDEEIARLTTLRQSLFTKLTKNSETGNEDKRVFKKRKRHEYEEKYNNVLNFKEIAEKILVIKIIENKLIAASERGKIYFFNLQSGEILSVVEVTTFSITSICFWNFNVFIGSYEPNLKQLNFHTKEINTVQLLYRSLCMEVRWDFIFIGCTDGTLLRYSLMKGKVEFEEKISETGIFVLIPAQEGARRVLLIGVRYEPICVRDAMSGLHMRVMDNRYCPIVYSLLLINDFVYCGTSKDILVFSFHDGRLVTYYSDTDTKGVTTIKIVGQLLFASCYNGNVYAYSIETHKLVGVIEGPGGAILSMEIEKNLIFVGTIKCHFKAILIPDDIFKYKK